MDLKPGDVICPDCNGESYNKPWEVFGILFKPTCLKCYGAGKLDWIENIVGKKFDVYGTLILPNIRKKYPQLIAKDFINNQQIYSLCDKND